MRSFLDGFRTSGKHRKQNKELAQPQRPHENDDDDDDDDDDEDDDGGGVRTTTTINSLWQ